MSNINNTLPIGKLLQNAGLISSEQLESALKVQAQYTNMKLGEILSLQEAIGVKTVDFFVEKWQEIQQEGQQFPLGHYLKKACLLSDRQIQNVLEEQKTSKLKFGDIVVQKGWLERGTIEFFLNGLTLKSDPLMSLIALEEYNRESLHLDEKHANSSLILSRILAWTGGNQHLTKTICHSFIDADLNIPVGMEVKAVDKLIEGSLIRNWQTTKLGTYIRAIKESLIDNQKCEPILLLSEFEKILLSNGREYLEIKEQDELLNLGLIVREKNQLRVTNLIFQQIFNQNWLIETKKILENKIVKESNKLVKTNQKNAITRVTFNQKSLPEKVKAKSINSQSNGNTIEKTEPLTKISSLLTLVGILLFIPLVISINNYYSSRQDRVGVSEPLSISPANKIKQFCDEVNLTDASSSLNLIFKLETSKQEILKAFPNNLENFPNNCEVVLNKLRVLAAPQLGKKSRVIEAIGNLCKMPADAENINEAKVWIEHWYNSAAWGKETKSYLNLINDCPAGTSIVEN